MKGVRRLRCCGAAVVLGLLAVAPTAASDTLLRLDTPSPLATISALADRLLSPLTSRRLMHRLAATGASPAAATIDVGREQFRLVVPPEPAGGYGLLVFVPPWDDARLPLGWGAVLARHGMIFVTAAGSGNDVGAFDRREPLALTAAAGVMARFPVDPARVYVGGFSGGSRIALRLALAYPDLFRGAFLDAGADALGDMVPLPRVDRLDQFRTASRLVFFAGADDAENLGAIDDSMRSLRRWCASNAVRQTEPRLGHAIAPPDALDRALAALAEPVPPLGLREMTCRTRIAGDAAAALDRAAAAAPADARRLVERLDRTFGGLAAPRSAELDARFADRSWSTTPSWSSRTSTGTSRRA